MQMPIELKELVIRTSIGSQNQSHGTQQNDTNQDAVVSACVKEVLKQLRQEEQR